VRANFARRHALALRAIEGIIKEDWRYAQFVRRKVIKDFVGCKGMIEVAHASVVATDDEMGASVVFANDGVENSFARSSVKHRRRVDSKDYTLLREIPLNQNLITPHPDISGDVIGFGRTDKRVEQKTINGLKGTLDKIFVRAMKRVSSLKAHDPFVSASDKKGTGFLRGHVVGLNNRRVLWQLKNENFSANEPIWLTENAFNARMA
jgi:hypothetical protein